MGEYLYSMEGSHDLAIGLFEQAVELASRLNPALHRSKELADAHEWLGRCFLAKSDMIS
jgi:hypothetical protein